MKKIILLLFLCLTHAYSATSSQIEFNQEDYKEANTYNFEFHQTLLFSYIKKTEKNLAYPNVKCGLTHKTDAPFIDNVAAPSGYKFSCVSYHEGSATEVATITAKVWDSLVTVYKVDVFWL